MNIIRKYELEIKAKQRLWMAEDARILSAQPIGNKICIWAMLDPEWEETPTTFYIVGTDQEIDNDILDKCSYLDTVLTNNGANIWHIFMQTKV